MADTNSLSHKSRTGLNDSAASQANAKSIYSQRVPQRTSHSVHDKNEIELEKQQPTSAKSHASSKHTQIDPKNKSVKLKSALSDQKSQLDNGTKSVMSGERRYYYNDLFSFNGDEDQYENKNDDAQAESIAELRKPENTFFLPTAMELYCWTDPDDLDRINPYPSHRFSNKKPIRLIPKKTGPEFESRNRNINELFNVDGPMNSIVPAEPPPHTEPRVSSGDVYKKIAKEFKYISFGPRYL